MTDLTTERATGPPRAGPDPAVPDRVDRDACRRTHPRRPVPEGVALPRLLSLVRLSAPQALELGAGLLAATAGRDAPVVPDRAIVSTDGHVVLGPDPDGGRSGAQPALGSVLADVAGAARLRGRPADPAAEALLDRARPGGSGPAGRRASPPSRRRLQETLAGTDRDRVRAELAALVARRRRPGGAGTGPARRARRRRWTAPLRRTTRGREAARDGVAADRGVVALGAGPRRGRRGRGRRPARRHRRRRRPAPGRRAERRRRSPPRRSPTARRSCPPPLPRPAASPPSTCARWRSARPPPRAR